MALPTARVGGGVIRVWERDISREVNYFPNTLGGGDRRGTRRIFRARLKLCARHEKLAPKFLVQHT